MKKPIKNGKEVFAVLSMATVMSISMSVKTHAASDLDLAAETAAIATRQADDNKKTLLLNNGEEANLEDYLLELSGGYQPENLRVMAAASNEPNYSTDEKKINDYSGSERYRETDLQPGNTNQEFYNTDEKVEKDGFKFEFKNPSATSPSKTEYGWQITIDKKKGQRTYTKLYVTDSGRIPVETGDKPMMDEGEKITSESPDVTYKPTENSTMDAGGSQRNLNYDASQDTLNHINDMDNPLTSFGMKDNYTKDNPGIKFFGDSFLLGYKVNPWPNENDKLEELKLNKQGSKLEEKYFVQGQDIDTGIKIDNVDENAKERLVGQVYNPITGDIVPGASAYIADDGNVHVKLPEGALKKDENGKTVINEDSIFNTADYKALQNLDVKFFARPRTAEEFTNIAETPDDYGETGTYVETGAGTRTINHDGKDIEVANQGIDRYDHYNLIGDFKLNLDDTRYYDQSFQDGNGDDTTKVDISDVQPDVPFEVKIVQPDNPGSTDKSAEDMNDAQDRGEASGELLLTLFDKENKGKAEEDKWKLDVKDKDISKFTITPPASAKAGDSTAIAVKYTYTNGSTDLHWFHFVVQESTYIKPEYDTQVNFPVNKQTSPATLKEDAKKIKPDHYTLPDTLETDDAGNKLATDDKGNKWTVTVDETTGEVTAKPVNPDDFDGGEKLTVPVIAHYKDEQKPGEDITEEVKAYFVIEEKANMTPRYNAKAGKEGDTLASDVILNEEDRYNRRPGKFTLDSPTYTDDKGNVWNVTIDEKTGKVTATVPNAEEGQTIDGALLNVPVTAHYYEEDEEGNQVEAGTKQTEVQFVAYGTNGKVEKTLEIPFETKVEKDPNLKKGEIKVITEGEKGSKKVTYTIVDSEITETKEEELKAPQDRLIHVGEGVNDGTHTIEEKVEVPFEVEIQFDDSLAPGEQEVIQEGAPGEKKRDITLTIEDGNVTKTETGEFTETKAPQKKIIKVGANTEGKVEHKEEIPFKYTVEFDPKFHENYPDATDNYKIVTDGVAGEKTTTWTIKNSKIVEGPTENITKEPVDAVIKVGKKDYNGTFNTKETKAVEFDTEYRVNNELKPGEVKVVQKGELGEEQVTVTHTIENGKVINSEKGQPERTKEPVKRIVEVGPGATDGTYERVEEIPFETIVEKDPNLKKGEIKVITEGEKGSKKVTYTIKDSKVDETKTKEEVIKEATDRVIHVGEGVNDGTHTITEEVDVPFETKIEFDDSLKPGEQKVTQEGEPGKKNRDITLTIQDGKVTNTEEGEFTQTKAPKDKIIKVGRNTEGKVEHKEELPFDYKVEEVEDLKKGEYRIVKPGKVGTKTTTWTIENSKVVGEPTVEIIEAEDALIQVGKGTNDGTHDIVEKKELPFETRYEYDDSLEPGEEKVVSEGSPGEQERTNTIVIKDGKVVEVQEGEFKTTKDPVDRVIKIGRKPTDGEYTKTIEREIPYETKVIYDETLEAGFQKIENEGKPGKEEVTITQKIKDSKPVGDPTETTKTITEKEDRIVRVGVKPVEKIVELGHDTEYRHNPELKEGETKVIEEGSKGSVKYTTTFNKKTGKLEVTEERVDPTNKIVEYGTKTDGEFTYESEKAYDIIIRENPNLEAGKTKVIQEGIVGITETTVKIENSKEVDRTTKTITEKQDKIIEIGTKNVCEIPPVDPENPDKPGDKDPETPGKPGDKDPETPDKPGDKDPENPDKPGDKDPEKPGKPDEDKPKYPRPSFPRHKDPRPNRPFDPDKNTPSEPNDKTPNKPEDKDPNKIVENPSEDPKDSPQESPEKPETEDLVDVENNSTPEEVKEEKSQEEVEDYGNVKNKTPEKQEARVGDKAPKTQDPGIMREIASAGLASGLLLLLKRFKRRK